MTTRLNIAKNFKLTLLSFIILLESCLTGGTHGSIKSYGYKVSKYVLQEAVNKVIANTPNIQLAPVTDSFTSRYYNDGEYYVTINIKIKEGLNNYTFQYAGDKEYWDTSKNANLSIAYAFDKDGNGGSEGDGINWYNWTLKKKLLKSFESEFIFKVDKELNLNHVDTK